jgi:hypothetical protein
VVKNGMKTLKEFEKELNRISKWENNPAECRQSMKWQYVPGSCSWRMRLEPNGIDSITKSALSVVGLILWILWGS